MNVKISIKQKIAVAENPPVIVCGNSDYVAVFQFDSEWNAYETKTARFLWIRNSKLMYTDVVFTGNTCQIPVLTNTNEVRIGVYAGDLKTTTPARVKCEKSILCSDPIHIPPPEDIYNQLLEIINAGGVVTSDETTVKDAETGLKYKLYVTNGKLTMEEIE